MSNSQENDRSFQEKIGEIRKANSSLQVDKDLLKMLDIVIHGAARVDLNNEEVMEPLKTGIISTGGHAPEFIIKLPLPKELNDADKRLLCKVILEIEMHMPQVVVWDRGNIYKKVEQTHRPVGLSEIAFVAPDVKTMNSALVAFGENVVKEKNEYLHFPDEDREEALYHLTEYNKERASSQER